MSDIEATLLANPCEPGSICDTCGHFAARHDETGCHFPSPPEKEPCMCQVMQWGGIELLRPWAPGIGGTMRTTKSGMAT